MVSSRKIIILTLFPALLSGLSSCKVGPNYKRPVVATDSLYRFAKSTDTNSLANVKWIELFKDTVLQRMIRTGLENNYDIRIAYARIEEARANFKIQRGKLYPQINASANGGWTRQLTPSTNQPLEYSSLQAVAGLSWELDIWGKLRRSKEAARANLFAQAAYQQAVRINLIHEIVSNYFDLLEYDNEMRITRENIVIREKSLALVKAKMIAGTASGLVVAQAEAELALAQTQVPHLDLLIGMKENTLSILLGESPHGFYRGRPMLDQINPPSVSTPGIPSQLIVRRPDIIMAEQQLIAANANIGVARAMMLPTLSLSGDIGAAFNPTTLIYNAIGGLIAPIFGGGQLRAGVKKAQAQKEQMLYTYMKTIDNSLQEVSNALLEVKKQNEIVKSQQVTVSAAQTAFDLSSQLYNAGYASYLDVINAQSMLFSSQLNLSMAQSNELTALITLYAALGGGWR